MLSEQVDYLIQLFVVAVAVHEDFKLRVASFGFSRLYVDKVDVVFLQETCFYQKWVNYWKRLIKIYTRTDKEPRVQWLTWKSLSAFTNPPTSFLREKMIVALPFSDVLFFSEFSSIFVKVDLFIWKKQQQKGGTDFRDLNCATVRNHHCSTTSSVSFFYSHRRRYSAFRNIFLKMHIYKVHLFFFF